MRNAIIYRILSMNWFLKTGLVPNLTLLVSLFMLQGWYNPGQVEAAPLTNVSTGTLTSGWAHPSTGTAGPWTITNATFSCGAGSNRLLVAVVTGETGTAAAAAVTASKGNGNNFTTAVSSTSSRTQVWMGYLTESQISAAGTNSILISNSSGQAWTNSDVYLACYSGVDQATPLVSGGTYSAVGTTATTTSISVAALLDGMVIDAISRGATATRITPPAGYTEPYDLAGTGYSSGISFKPVSATGTETGAFTLSAADTRFAHAAISLKPAVVAATGDTLTVGTNFPIATNASDSAANVVMQRLKLDSNANGDSQVTLGGITLDEAGTATAISNVRIYIDTAAQSTLPGSAVLIGNLVSWNGASTTVPLTQGTAANRTVAAGTSKYLYVVFDMASGQAGKSVQSHVTAVSVASPDTGVTGLIFSSNSFTLTAGPVASITSCSGCHGNPPVDGTARNVPAGQFQGSHNTHLNPCSVCHVDNGTNLKHANGSINMATPIHNAGGAYSKSATFAVSNSAFVAGTCSGINCHGQGTPAWGASSTAPVNGFPYSASQCDKCHSGTATAPFYSTATPKNTASTDARVGAHTSHLTTPDGLAAVLACSDCHGTVVLNTASHMNGVTNFTWNSLATRGGALTPTYTAATRVCANVYCHGGGMPGGDTSGSNRAPVWNVAFLSATLSRAACASCHGFPPPVSAGHPAVTIPASWPATGAATAALGTTCSCHANISTTGTTYANIFVNKTLHINGTVEVSGGHAVPFYAHATPPFSSCTGCHNASAAGPYPAATAGAAPNCRGCHAAADPTLTSTGCTSCHSTPPSGTARPNVIGSHAKHGAVACATCHNGAGAGSGAAHGPGNKGTNPAVDNVVFTAAQAGASATWAAATKTCSSTYCHGATTTGGTNKSPAWGTTLTGCSLCHGNPPATATHAGVTSTQCINCHTHVNATGTGFSNAALHINGTVEGGDCVSCHSTAQPITAAGAGALVGGTRRAVSLEFANAWSHKRSAGGTVSKYDCIVCHMEGEMATGSTTTAHKNGLIELRDPDTGLTIKGVTWGGTGAGAYTSTASDMTFNRFSRNLASAAIEPAAAAVQINLCLKCHDADGALSASARVPGGSAQKPFATTIAGATYTGAGVTAGGVLGGVTDIKASFATSNSSYHPVSGKQNNSYTQGTRMVAPWNLAKTNGNNTQWGNLITCWDCHAPLNASGIQSSTVTAHGGAVTLRQPVFGTNPTTGNAGGLCITCHAGYNTNTSANHGAGSAFTSNTDSGMTTYLRGQCHACHSSWSTADGGAPVRPFRAQDVHGFDSLRKTSATDKLWPVGATETYKPYGFIRAGFTTQHKPLSGSGVPTGSASCSGYGGVCSRSSMGSYTPGGVY
jgi:predicted CxxxxCH...CXXCH cytochrome family protein